MYCSSILKAFLVSLGLLHVCIGECWGWAWDLINSYTEFGVPYFSSIFFKKPFLPTLQVIWAPFALSSGLGTSGLLVGLLALGCQGPGLQEMLARGPRSGLGAMEKEDRVVQAAPVTSSSPGPGM